MSYVRMKIAMIIAYRHRQANLFGCSLINFDRFSGELCMNEQNATLKKNGTFDSTNVSVLQMRNTIIIIITMAEWVGYFVMYVMWSYEPLWSNNGWKMAPFNCICPTKSNESNKTAITAKYVYG